ncbi:MAG: PadR family transcriptional regulator [Oscillospiraceae bacterium]|nr:hypothetical protein [Oscillospiraceae bacterium]MDE6931267.1 PadR family transcriptional regulator [Oscillospiraceae bacterium]
MEENLKKALLELLVLALLYERDNHVPELTAAIAERSGGTISIVFPYAILYRMIDQGYIQELPKRRAPDGRRRQYFGITEAGRTYFREILGIYRNFTGGVDRLINGIFPSEEGDFQ